MHKVQLMLILECCCPSWYRLSGSFSCIPPFHPRQSVILMQVFGLTLAWASHKTSAFISVLGHLTNVVLQWRPFEAVYSAWFSVIHYFPLCPSYSIRPWVQLQTRNNIFNHQAWINEIIKHDLYWSPTFQKVWVWMKVKLPLKVWMEINSGGKTDQKNNTSWHECEDSYKALPQPFWDGPRLTLQ